jgi:myo-inositol-1(or 4)-monophosphatase
MDKKLPKLPDAVKDCVALRKDPLLAEVVAVTLAAGEGLRLPVEERRRQGFTVKSSIRSIATPSDVKSERMVIKRLGATFPDAFFIGEEGTQDEDPASLTPKEFERRLDGLVFGIDPLDGTAQYHNGLYDWSVSIGAMKKREHVAGAIFAPDIQGGLLLFGNVQGLFLLEGMTLMDVPRLSPKTEKDCVIGFGMDCSVVPEHSRLREETARLCRAANSEGSCALGLLKVALGRLDALVQPPQHSWDWFAGYPLVLAVGGKVRFYRMVDGKFTPVAKPEPRDYPGPKMVGFVAGNPGIVDALFARLEQMYKMKK